jgi:hypothetical protein
VADGTQHLVADGAAGVEVQKVGGGLARQGDADGPCLLFLLLRLLRGQLDQLLGVPLDQHAFVFHVQLCLVGHGKHQWLVVAPGALDQGKAARALLYQLVQAGDGAGLLLHDGGGVHVKMVWLVVGRVSGQVCGKFSGLMPGLLGGLGAVSGLEAQHHGDGVGLAVVAFVNACHDAVHALGLEAVFACPLAQRLAFATEAFTDLFRGAHLVRLSIKLLGS